ncbi:MAG: S8 family serine peptidase [Rhodothermales bacterium]
MTRTLFHTCLLVAMLVGTLPSLVFAQGRDLAIIHGNLDPVDLIRAENPVQEFEVRLGTMDGRTHFEEGEYVSFFVYSERAGYVTLVNLNSEGDITVLLPNKYSENTAIGAGEGVSFPASAQDFRIAVRPPFGRELVKVIVTPEPLIIEEAAARYFASSGPFLAVEPGVPGGDGGDDLGGIPADQWAAASMYLNTGSHDREDPPIGEPPIDEPPVLEPPTPEARYGNTPEDAWDDLYYNRGGRIESLSLTSRQLRNTTDDSGEIIVLYRDRVGSRSIGNTFDGGGSNLLNNLRLVNPQTTPGARSFGSTKEEQLRRLNQDPDVLVAIPNYVVSIASPMKPAGEEDASSVVPSFWDLQWGLHNGFWRQPGDRVDMRWSEALTQYHKPTDPVIIGVVDTGIHLDNPHLRSVIWRNADEVPGNGIDDDGNGFVDDVNGWDFAYDDNNPTDVHGHGTFVASQIVGGSSEAGFYGMMPDAQVIPVRVLGDDGSGYTEDIIEGIVYAARNGAKIINLSLGGSSSEPDPYREDFYNRVFAALEDMGVLVVIAAGNDGASSEQQYHYPARVNRDNTLTIASVGMRGELSDFSNYGSRVHLAAPGERIVGHKQRDGRVDVSQGTSMATPYVVAVAAMVWSQHPSWTPLDVRRALIETTTPMSGLSGLIQTGGIVNAERAIAYDR